jgi:hypothetical protein
MATVARQSQKWGMTAMHDILEPTELTASELDFVVGGAAVATNLAALDQFNVGGSGTLFDINLNVGVVTPVANAINVKIG